MKRRATILATIVGGGACLAMGASSASAGLGSAEWSIHLAASGPGQIAAGWLSVRGTSFLLTTDARYETLTPTPDGNSAEFRGWVGACAPAETSTCVVTPGGVAMGLVVPCRWTAALFALPGEPTPAVANPCETAGGGGSSGGAGGSGSGGSGAAGGQSGGSSGGAAPQPPVGTSLQGGVTVVRTAPAIKGARTSVKSGVAKTTGRYPNGTTRMVQSLVFNGSQGVTARGKCRLQRTEGTFTCTSEPPRGRWRVITQAKRGTTVLGQSSTVVTVR
ncbi:MAG: hypothetical protein FJW99_02955 [Actinobacteria bacterium]|nr:hypothetical protein [Actinomycetota bacterium]